MSWLVSNYSLIGNVEVSYDADKGRVAYQPVSIEPRTLVPRVIRDDNRYSEDLKDGSADFPRRRKSADDPFGSRYLEFRKLV